MIFVIVGIAILAIVLGALAIKAGATILKAIFTIALLVGFIVLIASCSGFQHSLHIKRSGFSHSLFCKQKEAPRHSDEVLPINQFSLNSFKIKQALRNT